MEKRVKISIISELGDTQKLVPLAHSVDFVKQEVNQNGRWLYLDSKYTSAEAVTQADLERANEILLGDTLVGG